jgi:hypothetical protein
MRYELYGWPPNARRGEFVRPRIAAYLRFPWRLAPNQRGVFQRPPELDR